MLVHRAQAVADDLLRLKIPTACVTVCDVGRAAVIDRLLREWTEPRNGRGRTANLDHLPAGDIHGRVSRQWRKCQQVRARRQLNLRRLPLGQSWYQDYRAEKGRGPIHRAIAGVVLLAKTSRLNIFM
jgi:hypothetical protein